MILKHLVLVFVIEERSGLHYCVESSDVKRGQNLEVEDVAEAEAETEAKASRPKTKPEL